MDHAAWVSTFEAGRRRWPELTLDFASFMAHVDRLGVPVPPEPFGEDLVLACACALGHPRAIAVLEREFLQPARASIARVQSDPDIIEDAAQELRRKLLVGPPPRIASYEGRAPLTAWVRLAAARMAVDIGRGKGATIRADDKEIEGLVALEDPEVIFLRNRYREDFQSALRAALGNLSPRDRTLLRMSVLNGLSIDEIAVPHRVHRSTVARWLAEIRERILAEVRRHLGEKHPALTETEFSSLSRAVQSQLHLSLIRVLLPSSE